jgi:hypothetical protein
MRHVPHDVLLNEWATGLKGVAEEQARNAGEFLGLGR